MMTDKNSKGGLETQVENKGAFTFPGYNDEPKPCLTEKCGGFVMPTYNANVGKCNTCGEKYSWADYEAETDDIT